MILSDALLLPVSQLQTQLMMMPLIRSHIEYLIQRFSYSHFVVEIGENLVLMVSFNTI